MNRSNLSSIARRAFADVPDEVTYERYWLVRNALQRTANDLERAWEQDQCESHRVIMLSQEFDHLTQRLRQLDGAARKTYQL